MQISFSKYHGTGNDFILVDNREGIFPQTDQKLIQKLCARHYGIGADGLILLNLHASGQGYYMAYFNADGAVSSFCGNGSRCFVHFAASLGLFDQKWSFEAFDGLHRASLNDDLVTLDMQDAGLPLAASPDTLQPSWKIDTGSPHFLHYVNSQQELFPKDDYGQDQFVSLARRVRYSSSYAEEGINVNFLYRSAGEEHDLEIRTYERGVEDETQSCGTGVTAAALLETYLVHSASQELIEDVDFTCKIKSQGGVLCVQGSLTPSGFRNIQLIGPAKPVFKGQIEI
jgi:diaminopimelate epimerase